MLINFGRLLYTLQANYFFCERGPTWPHDTEKLSNFLREEGKLLGGLRQEVQNIRDELRQMRAFLNFAEANEEGDPRLQEWIKQVREAALDTEDVLDEFVFRFARHHSNGFYGWTQRVFRSIKNLRARRRVASEIQSIKSRITNISEAHQRYQSDYGNYDQQVSGSPNETWLYSRDDALLVEEANLVGINKPKQQLISLLLEGDSQLRVISVVGMGGLGKTTLVKKVHEDAEVKRRFQVRAWITVSHKCDIKELLKSLIRQFYDEIRKPVPEQVEHCMDSNVLKTFVKEFLQEKRYAIVFDDVWDIDFWNTIKFALPDGVCGNRVMLTTRIADVASASCIGSHNCVYKMQPLSFEKSWTLFCNKTFEDNLCPAHLKDVAQVILSKCEGLPLAIIAIGGFLALKDKNKIDEWEMVQRSLGGELEGTGKLDRVKKILSLSYNNLPSHLKTCLLYTSLFPEDYEIQCNRLMQLWIAERFVQRREGLTVEEVASLYLQELINRSLIQVASAYCDGELLTCRIHDLLREIILSKSREQDMVTIVTKQYTRWPEKVRRLVTYNFFGEIQERNCFNHLRSLLTFGSMESFPNNLLSEILCRSRLLKVLDLKGAQLEEIPDEVFYLFYLRYLCLRETKVKSVPKSIEKLQNLEVLDLVGTKVRELPMEILKLCKLRHLSVFQQCDYPDDYVYYGFRALNKIGSHLSLHTLLFIDADNDQILVREIGKMAQLRDLGITKLRREDGKELCSSIEKLTNLRKLDICAIEKDEVIDLNHSSFLALPFLHFLRLRGRLETLPQWISSLQGLTRIDLLCSGLNTDPLKALHRLPNLQEMYLNQAYQGEGLCFMQGGFLKLKQLFIVNFEVLKWVKVMEGAMPHLQLLDMTNLKSMEELPWGIQHLTNLQVLCLNIMSDKLIAKLWNQKEGSDDYQKIAHIPEVLIGNWTEDGWKKDRHVWRKKNEQENLVSSCRH